MLRAAKISAVLAFVSVLAACGDDDPVTPATDVIDSSDASEDAPEDSATDAPADIAEDTTEDAAPDVEDSGPDTPDVTDAADVVEDADVADSADAADTDPGDADSGDDAVDAPDVPDTPDVVPDVEPGCGNGIVEGDEECDDGNEDDGDECLSDCTAAACGDGILNRTFGRETFASPLVVDPGGVEAYVCDDGASCPAGATPSTCDVGEDPAAPEHGICQAMRFEYASTVTWGGGDGGSAGQMNHAYNWECFDYFCGVGFFSSYDADCGPLEMLAEITCEGIVDEECDDGDFNSDTADACRNDCTLPRCGDGITDSAEECDDGARENRDEPDACRRDCMLPACGDGILDTGEQCDDGVANADAPDACRLRCVLPACMDGILDEGEECDDGNDVNDDGCSNICRVPACRDGVLDTAAGEECDDGNDVNDDGCSNNCLLPQCGDGVINGEEECDDANDNDNDGCRNSCIRPRCGDEIISDYLLEETVSGPVVTGPTGATGHVCDDGASCFGTMCDVRENGSAPEHGICQALGYDQTVWVSWGGGPGDSDPEMPHAYNWTCRDFVCGPSGSTYDGDNCGSSEMLNQIRCIGGFTEQCDLGEDNADVPGAACRTTCLLPHCGDGVLDTDLGEECDDGNDVQDDGCSNICRLPQCGDGVIQSSEECDDGDESDTNECRNDCTLQVCGDAFLADAEDCDDGDLNADVPDASCRTNCSFPTCGDAIVDTGEECDDGNEFDRDECTTLCTAPRCGDGFRQRALGEECDDGNLVAGDGCDEVCLREEGAAQGHVVFIAHDFFATNIDTQRLIGNAAINLTDSAGEVRILGYDQYADSSAGGEPMNTDSAIRFRAGELGVSVTIDRMNTATEFNERIDDYDVFLVYEPESGSSSMTSTGSVLADGLVDFVERGGVVILCDFSSNGWAFLDAAGLIDFNRGGSGSSSANMDIIIPDDPLVDDVTDPYRATNGTGYAELSEDSEADVVVVDASGRPVVVHRYW